MVKTYPSRAGEYHLNPASLLEVLARITDYLISVPVRALNDNPEQRIPIVSVDGSGRTKYAVHAEVINQGSSNYIELAGVLVRGSDITLYINEHPRVTFSSDELHNIGRNYSLPEKRQNS